MTISQTSKASNPSKSGASDPRIFSLYTDAGITLAPTRGLTRIPKFKGFQNTPFTPGFVPREDENYVALLAKRFVVIDVDPRNFLPGDKPLARLHADCGLSPNALKDTFTVQTRNGGFHFYLSKNPNAEIRKSLKDYPGLEFHQDFITAAGSYDAETGKSYVIMQKSPLDVTPCPDTLLALLRRDEFAEIKPGDFTDAPADVATYIKYLSELAIAAVSGANGNAATYKTALYGRDLGISHTLALQLIKEHYNPRCSPSWSDEELETIVKNAYEYGRAAVGGVSVDKDFDAVDKPAPVRDVIWHKTKEGNIKITLANTVNWLEGFSNSLLRNILRYNLFSHRVEFVQPPDWRPEAREWTDEDAIHIKYFLSGTKFYEVSTLQIHEAVTIIARRKAYHPVREYLTRLQWDGVKRLDNWLSVFCGTALNPYTAMVGRKTLLGAVTRVFKPGCKFDYVLVLEGDQGVGKSLSIRTLAEPWFTDAAMDIKSKDAIEIIQGNWIIELAEMDVLSKAESRTLKAFITRQVDRCRAPYGRAPQDYPRQCIFIGSINPQSEGYLQDPTGNRRFWPVAVASIDSQRLAQERDQLWAEAYYAYKVGEPVYIDDRKIDSLARFEVQKRQQEDPWVPIIGKFMDAHGMEFYSDEFKSIVLTPSDVYSRALGGSTSNCGFRESQRIASILKDLGFEKRTMVHGKRVNFFAKPLDKIF